MDTKLPVDRSLELFPRRLAELRKARELTRPQLAAIAGINNMRVYRYESGEMTPRWADVERFADALGVGADYFRAVHAEIPQ